MLSYRSFWCVYRLETRLPKVRMKKPRVLDLLRADWGKCILLLLCCGLILWIIFPRYQDYVMLAKIERGLQSSQHYQEMMMHYYQVYGVFPTAADLYLGKDRYVEHHNDPYVSHVEMVGGKPAQAKLVMKINSMALGIQGMIKATYFIKQTPMNGYRWHCLLTIKSDNPALLKHVPKVCRELH